MIRSLLPKRPADAHKGTFGTALVVAGSLNYSGAAILAGEAAYRIGAGLVTLAVPTPLHSALAGRLPEATWLLLPHETGVISSEAARVVAGHMDKVDAMLMGPGWGMEETTQNFLAHLLHDSRPGVFENIGFIHTVEEHNGSPSSRLPPLVIDADGLKLLARIPDWPKILPKLTVLTPHPGEMSVLTGLPVKEIQRDRIVTAEKYAHQWGHVVVLKGAFTVIAEPEGRSVVIPVATSALAKAGTGDVLAGIIVGLRAQGLDGLSAAVAGAWLHAQAGILAEERVGNSASVLAGDVISAIAGVLKPIGEV
ncbi:MAG: NAD(P)H-hydrate dehydratase [Chloroflexi bacterium]|nr:NAD(P)H-hydrate dehydratase [Chloroflexota bacterium]